MTDFSDYQFGYLEWEIINPDLEITNITFENNHYSVNSEAVIKFYRNNRFKLVATMSKITIPHKLSRDHGPLGTFIEKENIIGTSRDGELKYKMTGIVMGGVHSTHKLGQYHIDYEANIIFDSIEIIYKENEPDVLNEWFLSSKPNFNFARFTKRKVEKIYQCLRMSIDDDEDEKKVENYNTSLDHFFIKTNNISFIISLVPKKYNPEWGVGFTIEYRKSFGNIPSKEMRDAISELVGFLFGNPLIKIGESYFDKEKYFTKQLFQNSAYSNIINICQSHAFPPISNKNSEEEQNIEIILSELLISYIELRKKLLLGGAIEKYWLAKYSSLGANLPILSSAVESLAEKVLKEHPKVKPYYIDYKEFCELIEDEILSISLKLEGNLNKDIILRKLQGASQRSIKDKLERLFEILGLNVGKIEYQAINARNKMAHAIYNEIADNEIKSLIKLTRAYEILFNRIILKILNFNGLYVDYYTDGFPQRNINDCISRN